jgi:hypothetical protein
VQAGFEKEWVVLKAKYVCSHIIFLFPCCCALALSLLCEHLFS